MTAIFVQYKDKQGTLAVLKYWETSQGKHEMKLISKFETRFVGFTTFATTMMTMVSKEAYSDHLCIVTPCHMKPHFPKIWVLSLLADKVIYEQTLEILPN